MAILDNNMVDVRDEKFSAATNLAHQKHYSHAKVSKDPFRGTPQP